MTKATDRQHLLAARARLSPAQRAAAATAIAAHASGCAPLATARRVAAYLALPSEPDSGPLIADLLARGAEVIVPVVVSDTDLAWVQYTGESELRPGALGIAEPVGERLGPEALASVDVVVLPALAVDRSGHRLGRGAGYYDRALADHRGVRCAVVYASELLAEVPHEPHDVPVHLVLTDGGVFRVPPPD